MWQLPHDKSPRPDGMTAEVYTACWGFMDHTLVRMIHEFQSTGSLATGIKDGLIRYIPKKADKRLLKDWRPLTMLNTVYKLIAKLLANRLKLLLPKLINPQQTGFIPGRYILENISIVWLTSDWLRRTKQGALFLKLDFEKAFDRVSHSHIWEAMHFMGIGSHFIR